MTAPATVRAPLPAPPEPPRLVSDGRARRADSARQPHDKWTFVLIPPGTGAKPRTLHVSVRRLRAITIAACTMAGTSVALTAILGLMLSSAPQIENEWKGIQLGVLAAAPASSTAAAVLPTVSVAPPASVTPVEAPPVVEPMSSSEPVAVAEKTLPSPIVIVAVPIVAPGPRPSPSIPIAAAPRRVVETPRPAAPAVRAPGAESRSGIIASLPVIGRITSNFARARRHPLLGVVRRHKGLDIAAPAGTRITAPVAGRVRFAGRQVGFGLTVEIDHGSGVVTRYAHCRTLSVAVGERVTAGEIIATVGSSGLATGPHLHYEILVRGRSVDPLRTSLRALLPSGASSDGGVSLPQRAPAAGPTALIVGVPTPPSDTISSTP